MLSCGKNVINQVKFKNLSQEQSSITNRFILLLLLYFCVSVSGCFTSSCSSVWNLKSYSCSQPPLMMSPIRTWRLLVHMRRRCCCTSIPATWLCLSVYVVPACILNCATVLDHLQPTLAQSAAWVMLAVFDSCLYGSGPCG